MSIRLFHVSDRPGIELFEPRPAPERSGIRGNAVWAIDGEHVPNYLLPRDCPRVTFHAHYKSAPADVERLIGSDAQRRVIAVEAGWLQRIRDGRVVLYELDPEAFVLHDRTAGYWVSSRPVVPRSSTVVEDLPGVLRERNVELRVLPSLWELREQVAASTLAFSIIRMRNAAPPPKGFTSRFPVP